MKHIDLIYRNGDLKEYQFWLLAVSFRQHTLGSAVLIAKRDIEKISDLTTEELIEMRSVMQEYETALMKAEHCRPDRFNYLQLGNSYKQLHFHCIPRYATKRTFLGRVWEDTTYGRPPIFVKKDEELSVEAVVRVKEYLLKYF